MTGLLKISHLEATARVLVENGNVAIIGMLSDTERVFTETTIVRRIIKYSEQGSWLSKLLNKMTSWQPE